MIDKHASRIELFSSTLAILRQGWYISESEKKIDLPSADEVIANAAMYSEPLHTHIDPVAPIQTEVRVENDDCVLVAKRLIDEGYNPAMLNLADLYTPGGLVEYGSGAQEENLCRRSNLILSLYPFSSSRIRQYPDLGMTESLLEDTPYNIPVISVAALSGPRIGADGLMFPEETEITLDKMRTILRIGMANFHDSLVLSAMGCGAFANPPAHIAKLFHQVIEEDEFKDTFRLIDFAILDGYRTGLRHNPEGNLKPFQREFGVL